MVYLMLYGMLTDARKDLLKFGINKLILINFTDLLQKSMICDHIHFLHPNFVINRRLTMTNLRLVKIKLIKIFPHISHHH